MNGKRYRIVASQDASVRCSHAQPVREYRSTYSNILISPDVGAAGRTDGGLELNGTSGWRTPSKVDVKVMAASVACWTCTVGIGSMNLMGESPKDEVVRGCHCFRGVVAGGEADGGLGSEEPKPQSTVACGLPSEVAWRRCARFKLRAGGRRDSETV